MVGLVNEYIKMNFNVDICETSWLRYNSVIMELLLKDHTTQSNIFWATDSYAYLGAGYQEKDEITIGRITGENEGIIRPRCVKSKKEQSLRTKDKAEVFTPSWICNKQNNLIDNAWFGRENVFNKEIDEENNTHSWISSSSPIVFPDEVGKGWEDYVRDTRMEITCGEAPYLASRYDSITGRYIPIGKRIGLLDRKLRVVNENAKNKEDWVKMVILSYQNILGFDWQGDNVLLARESLVTTFVEYYMERFHEKPVPTVLEEIAYIVSWNIWQMDGLKMVVPMSCHDIEDTQTFLFEVLPSSPKPCPGCKNNDYLHHNGVYCEIMDWEAGYPIKFYTLRQKNKQ